MHCKLVVMLVFIPAAVFFSASVSGVNVFRHEEADLTQWLLEKCDLHNGLRPVANYNESLQVKISVIIFNFLEVEEAETTINFVADVQLSYKHPCVSWGDESDPDTAQWSGIQRIVRYDDAAIFRPQLWISNSAGVMTLYDNGLTSFSYTTINQDGTMYMDVGKVFQIKCDINYRQFPFDRSVCTIKLEAAMSDDLVDMSLADENEGGFSFSENVNLELWSFKKIAAKDWKHFYPIPPPANYSAANFQFEMRRKPSFHMLSVICPCLVLQALQVSAGLMPPKLPDRSSYSMTVMLALSLMQNTVTDQLPRTSQTIIFVVSLCIQVIFGMLCTIYALLSCALAREEWFCKTVQLPLPIRGRRSVISVVSLQPKSDNHTSNGNTTMSGNGSTMAVSRIRIFDAAFFGTITLAAICVNIWAFAEMQNDYD